MVEALPAKVTACMDVLQVPNALAEIFRVIQRANKYIDETAPWVLAKDEANLPRLAAVLYNLCEVMRVAAVLLTPFLPNTTPKMAQQLDVYKRQALNCVVSETSMALPTLRPRASSRT